MSDHSNVPIRSTRRTADLADLAARFNMGIEGDDDRREILYLLRQMKRDQGQGDGSFSIGSDVWPGISKLIEECGELLQVAGKLIATSGDPEHWDGSDLRERLVEEMGDLWGALYFVWHENLTDEERAAVRKRSGDKFLLFVEWQTAQAPSGSIREGGAS